MAVSAKLIIMSPVVRALFFVALLCCTTNIWFGSIQEIGNGGFMEQSLDDSIFSDGAVDKERASRSSLRLANTGRTPKADGTFNGFNLYKANRPPKTFVHCVGDNYQKERSWLFRSCEFRTMCFDTKRRDFVVFPDKPPLANGWTSTSKGPLYPDFVAAGAQNKDWWHPDQTYYGKTKIGRFSPRIEHYDIPSSYYRFNATWLPFYRHQRSPYNPGHLVWDDFLGLYTLVDIFDRTNDNLMLTHMMRPATDDFSGDEPVPEDDFDLIRKFIGLMGEHTYPLQTLEGDYTVEIRGKPRHAVICADHGLIGSGLFSDHGSENWHGQQAGDYKFPHNHGRGGHFRRFRKWMLHNMGLDADIQMQHDPYLVVFNANSTTKRERSHIEFDEHVNLLQTEFGNRVKVMHVAMSKLSLMEQIKLMSKTSIFVSTVGGGTVSGTFLPPGASMILYYSRKPLDWDFWNNYPHVRAHWQLIPEGIMRKKDAIREQRAFRDLVQRELDTIDLLHTSMRA